MPDALIGSTGFIGGNLAAQHAFADHYASANIDSVKGRRYRLIACAAAPGRKWLANREPDADRRSIDRLIGALERVEADHLVLISTVDVYSAPLGVDENSPVDRDGTEPYGRHRRLLEEFVQSRFESSVIRLPALFGPGLKKNVIYDFLHDNRLDLIHPDSTFQFYDLAQLWADIGRVRTLGLALVNFATEPVAVRDVAQEAFGFHFESSGAATAVHYDVRTLHAAALGGSGPYLRSRRDVLRGLRDFVAAERSP